MSKLHEYQQAVLVCHMAARMLAAHDLKGLIADIDRADAVGPIVDPSLWMKKRGAMREDLEVLRAALPLAQLGRELAEQS